MPKKKVIAARNLKRLFTKFTTQNKKSKKENQSFLSRQFVLYPLTSKLPLIQFPNFPLLRYPIPPLHLVCVSLSPPPTLALSLSLTDTPICVFPLRSHCLHHK